MSNSAQFENSVLQVWHMQNHENIATAPNKSPAFT